jgi:hypothetical protein
MSNSSKKKLNPGKRDGGSSSESIHAAEVTTKQMKVFLSSARKSKEAKSMMVRGPSARKLVKP